MTASFGRELFSDLLTLLLKSCSEFFITRHPMKVRDIFDGPVHGYLFPILLNSTINQVKLVGIGFKQVYPVSLAVLLLRKKKIKSGNTESKLFPDWSILKNIKLFWRTIRGLAKVLFLLNSYFCDSFGWSKMFYRVIQQF